MSDGNCRINLPISILHEEAQVQLPTFFAAVLFNNSVPLDGPPFVGHIWIHFPAAKQNVDKCVWLHFPANMVRWDWLLDCQNFRSARAIIRLSKHSVLPRISRSLHLEYMVGQPLTQSKWKIVCVIRRFGGFPSARSFRVVEGRIQLGSLLSCQCP